MLPPQRALNWCIGEVYLCLKQGAPSSDALWCARHPDFESPPRRSDVDLYVHDDAPPDLAEGGNETYDIGIVSHSITRDHKFWRFRTHDGDNRDLYTLRWDNKQAIADVWIPGSPSTSIAPGSAVDAVLVGHYLIEREEGVTVHASGVEYRGHGLLFFGFSGAGKSTMARQWRAVPESHILCDDRVIVRRGNDGGFWLYGTPWHSKVPIVNNIKAPLEAVFLLRHAPENHAARLSPGVAATQLAARSALPYWDAESSRFILDFVSEIALAVPCYELGFLPNATVVDYLQSFLQRPPFG